MKTVWINPQSAWSPDAQVGRSLCSATSVTSGPRSRRKFWPDMLSGPVRNLWRVARGTWWHLETRKSFVCGSANGNRTCIAPVQSSSVRSKCLQTRASCMTPVAPRPPRSPDVAPRWHLGGTLVAPRSARTLAVFRAPGAHVRAVAARWWNRASPPRARLVGTSKR